MKAKVKFLNHSSILVEYNDTKILCDPWFSGLAFQDGWSLLKDSSHDINELDYDYIWISHEHPDHFSIKDISSINNPTTFLYQSTSDQKVKKFLENKGHQVIELEDSARFKLGSMSITSFVCDGYDSSIFFEFSDGTTFLNCNDARLDLGDEIFRMKKIINQPIDLIASQFSYANWAGNSMDNLIPLEQQEMVNNKNKKILESFKPRAMMLFASFVYLSHEENFYWNKSFVLNAILSDVSAFDDSCSIITPIPDQEITIENPFKESFDNTHSIEYWENLHSKIQVISKTQEGLAIESLRESYKNFYSKLWSSNKKNMVFINEDNDEEFFLITGITDLNVNIKIGLKHESFEVISSSSEADCSVSAEVFIFLMKNLFARGTVVINSRIQFNYKTAHRFFIFFFIAYANNIGRYFEQYKLTKNELTSITKTSVMQSILKTSQISMDNFYDDLFVFHENN